MPEEKQEAIRVSTREEFNDAVEELFETGRPVEAPSVEALEAWAVDLEDEGGGIEGHEATPERTRDGDEGVIACPLCGRMWRIGLRR